MHGCPFHTPKTVLVVVRCGVWVFGYAHASGEADCVRSPSRVGWLGLPTLDVCERLCKRHVIASAHFIRQ